MSVALVAVAGRRYTYILGKVDRVARFFARRARAALETLRRDHHCSLVGILPQTREVIRTDEART